MIVFPKLSFLKLPATAIEPPSIPLYVAGLLVSSSGILAVTTSIDDPVITVTMMTFTIIGFVFAVGCRFLRLNLHLAELMIIAVLGYGASIFIAGDFDWMTFVSQDQMNVAALSAWALTLWSWVTVTDGLLLMSAPLAIAAIGLISSSPQATPLLPPLFTVLLGSSLFLLAHHQALRRKSDAVPDEQLRESRLLPAQIGAAAAALVMIFVVSATIVVLLVNVIMGQMSLRDALHGLTQFAGANQPQSRGQLVADLPDMQIGMGSGWDQSSDLVADVHVSDNQPHYWKCRTYDRYTGTGWTSTVDGQNHTMPMAPLDGTQVAYFAASAPSSRPEALLPPINSTVHVIGDTTEIFYTGEPSRVILDHPVDRGLEQCLDGHIDPVSKGAVTFNYDVTSQPLVDPESADSMARLRRCDENYPPDISAMYIGGIDDNDVTTTADVDYFRQTVHSVIDSLPSTRRTEIDEAIALRDYVAHRCTYSLNVAALAPGSDHVRQFLQTTRMGYCDLFASSMAVLCRMAGIPSRLVTGFAPGTGESGHYILHVSDKHAWVEVYFHGYGWLTFDPTAGSTIDGSNKADAAGSQHRGNPILAYIEAHGPFAAAVQLSLLLIFLYIIKVELVDGVGGRWRSRPGVVARVGGVTRDYHRMLRAAAALGVKRRESETPYEFAARAVSYLEQLQAAVGRNLEADAVATITRRFVAMRYGTEAVQLAATHEDDGSTARFLVAAAQARARLLFIRIFRRRTVPPASVN